MHSVWLASQEAEAIVWGRSSACPRSGFFNQGYELPIEEWIKKKKIQISKGLSKESTAWPGQKSTKL